MSKLTTEKFLKKQKGVSVYWFTEGQPTVTGAPKQPSVLFQPQTQSNNLPVFDPNKALPDNFDKINPNLPTTPSNPVETVANTVSQPPLKEEQDPKLQEGITKLEAEISNLRAQLNQVLNPQDISNEVKLGSEAATQMPNPKQAEGFFARMKDAASWTGDKIDKIIGKLDKPLTPKQVLGLIALAGGLTVGTAFALPVIATSLGLSTSAFVGGSALGLGANFGTWSAVGLGAAGGAAMPLGALGAATGALGAAQGFNMLRNKPQPQQSQPSTENLDQPTQTPTIPTEQAKVEAESGENLKERIDLVIETMKNGDTTNFNGIKITFVKTPDNKTAIAEITLENGGKSPAITTELLKSSPKLVAHLEKELKIKPSTETTSSSNESKSPENSEKSLEQRVNDALDTLATLPEPNQVTFKHKGNEITVKNNEGDVSVNGKVLDKTELSTFKKLLAKDKPTIKSLEQAIANLPKEGEVRELKQPKDLTEFITNLESGTSTTESTSSTPESTKTPETREAEPTTELKQQILKIAELTGKITDSDTEEAKNEATAKVTKQLAESLGIKVGSEFGEKTTEQLMQDLKGLFNAGEKPREHEGRLNHIPIYGKIANENGLKTDRADLNFNKEVDNFIETLAKGQINKGVIDIQEQIKNTKDTYSPLDSKILPYLDIIKSKSILPAIRETLLNGDEMKKLIEACEGGVKDNTTGIESVLKVIGIQNGLNPEDEQWFESVLESTLSEIKQTLGLEPIKNTAPAPKKTVESSAAPTHPETPVETPTVGSAEGLEETVIENPSKEPSAETKFSEEITETVEVEEVETATETKESTTAEESEVTPTENTKNIEVTATPEAEIETKNQAAQSVYDLLTGENNNFNQEKFDESLKTLLENDDELKINTEEWNKSIELTNESKSYKDIARFIVSLLGTKNRDNITELKESFRISSTNLVNITSKAQQEKGREILNRKILANAIIKDLVEKSPNNILLNSKIGEIKKVLYL